MLLLAGTFGAAILRERQTRRAAERLGAAALETLLNAIDANDAQTGAHVRRVAGFALLLARGTGLTRDEQREVERVALFHDIGKIHAALFDIIHDRTTLTPEERRAVVTHPRRGAEVLAPLAAFYPELADGVLAHHERWDGTGYPRGLAGARIPLTARIVAIADTFDAVTHQRRYKTGRSAVEGARVLTVGRGTQFDPRLVDAFLSPPVWPAVLEAMHADARPERPAVAGRDRRRGRAERHAPDLTFRWRLEAPVPPPRDPAPTESP